MVVLDDPLFAAWQLAYQRIDELQQLLTCPPSRREDSDLAVLDAVQVRCTEHPDAHGLAKSPRGHAQALLLQRLPLVLLHDPRKVHVHVVPEQVHRSRLEEGVVEPLLHLRPLETREAIQCASNGHQSPPSLGDHPFALLLRDDVQHAAEAPPF